MNSLKRHDWKTVIKIAGGIAIGTTGVVLVVTAPLEIAITAMFIGATKYALDKTEQENK